MVTKTFLKPTLLPPYVTVGTVETVVEVVTVVTVVTVVKVVEIVEIVTVVNEVIKKHFSPQLFLKLTFCF